MGDGNSLVSMGDISRPATVLIEKISDAIGGIYKPFQIRRVAKAEAEADIIRAHFRRKTYVPAFTVSLRGRPRTTLYVDR